MAAMLEPFPIIEIPAEARSDVEQLGSKPKFWFKHQEQDWLFKESRDTAGEDWSEKVASEVAHLMGLPTHHAELAIWQGRSGCAVKSFIRPNQGFLTHGNELLGGLITGYDKEKQRGQADHTFDNIVQVLEKLFTSDKDRLLAASHMVGYLVLDAFIGNTDRHHQNWGVLVERRSALGGPAAVLLRLAPTFDHASSLGRELTDAARARYLREGAIERYVRNGRGGIFEHPQSKHGMSPIALAEMLAQRYPIFFKSWQTRVADLSESALAELLERVPDSRISPLGRKFALALLTTTRNMLKKAL